MSDVQKAFILKQNADEMLVADICRKAGWHQPSDLATGRKRCVLTIVDTFSRFSLADAVEVLERVGREVGLPATIRVDQGTEFVSRDLDLWAYQR